MPAPTKTSRTQVWFDTLGEWSWPGRAAEAVDALPPAWVPTFPPRLEPVVAAATVGAGAWGRKQPRTKGRALLIGVLLSALAALVVVLALRAPQNLDGSLTGQTAVRAARSAAGETAVPQPLPTLVAAGRDRAGSSIDAASYNSAALAATGAFHVYLPPGYASTTQRYPVLYLLHGNNQPATAFLEIGLQGELDTLIARREIPPLIAVMIQGGRGANNWRDRYERYVVEVQELIDRMLPTVATRGARAVAGDSMGGYGAMNVALGHPRRFSVVESWLGFFDGLSAELRSAQPVIAREGLHAFVYGGESDHIAAPAENLPFAAQLRAAGASAHGVVYPGEHSMQTLHAHLPSMLRYAGRALAANTSAGPAQAPRAAHTTAATR